MAVGEEMQMERERGNPSNAVLSYPILSYSIQYYKMINYFICPILHSPKAYAIIAAGVRISPKVTWSVI